MRPQFSTLSEFFSQRRLYLFDGMWRAIPSILTIALVLTLLYAIAESYRAGMLLWLLGALVAYGMPTDRGFRSARIIKHKGYRFKSWRGYDGYWCWQSVDWPFLEQHGNQDEYQARRTIDDYISAFILPDIDQTPSADESRKENAYRTFCKWAQDSELTWSPRIQELSTELNYWRHGDTNLYTEAQNHYDSLKRARELDSGL
jgi:hypothetical protein